MATQELNTNDIEKRVLDFLNEGQIEHRKKQVFKGLVLGGIVLANILLAILLNQ